MIDTSYFKPGQRVQLCPSTDRWMMGDMYGTVASVGRKVVRVKMDRSGKTIRVAPDRLMDACR